MKLFELLLESRVEFLRDKYIPLLITYLTRTKPKIKGIDTATSVQPDKVAIIVFDKLSQIDPTKNKEYLQWLLNETLKLYKRDFELLIGEDGYKWNEYLTIYHKVKKKLDIGLRDINKIGLFGIKEIGLKYKDQDEMVLTKSENLAKNYLIFENQNFEVYKFDKATTSDFDKYQLVSTNTEWCTRPDYDTFKDYVNISPLYVFINKKNRNLKYQYHFDIYTLNEIFEEIFKVEFNKNLEKLSLIIDLNYDDYAPAEQFMDKDDNWVSDGLNNFLKKNGIPENLIVNNTTPYNLKSGENYNFMKYCFNYLNSKITKQDFFEFLNESFGSFRLDVINSDNESPEGIIVNLIKEYIHLKKDFEILEFINSKNLMLTDIKTSKFNIYEGGKGLINNLTTEKLMFNYVDEEQVPKMKFGIKNSKIKFIELEGNNNVELVNNEINKIVQEHSNTILTISNCKVNEIELFDLSDEIYEMPVININKSEINDIQIDLNLDNLEDGDRSQFRITNNNINSLQLNISLTAVFDNERYFKNNFTEITEELKIMNEKYNSFTNITKNNIQNLHIIYDINYHLHSSGGGRLVNKKFDDQYLKLLSKFYIRKVNELKSKNNIGQIKLTPKLF